jgi:phage head maturation protease
MDMSAAEGILRAGHWKHDYIPLDAAAAQSKFHGHVPSGWKPGATHGTGGSRHEEHAKQIAEHAREFSARGSGTNHEKVGYLMYQAAQALHAGDRKTALTHLGQAHAHAGQGRAVHARGVGDAQHVIAQHMEKLRGNTARRALAHEPLGKPGGPGLFHRKGMQLPAFVQHIARDLMESRGMPESEAIATAVAQCKKWAAGGQDVKPETRAKAAAAVAEWERLKAGTHGKTSAPQGGGMSRSELFRSYPLEDYHIVRTGEGDSSGRVVEAYMTVFDEETEIYDGQGRYREAIDRAAFNKRIADLERSRNGFAAAKVFYNHGMTIHGTPSDRYSMPTAVCEGIRADTRGPVTRSRYLDTPLGNEVLEMWRSGAVTAQSFTGAIIRSSPELRPGEKYKPRNGQLPQVRRLELGLKEYGPTPFPAYQGAELVGVRMSPLGTWTAADDEAEETDEIGDEALPPDEEAAPGGPPDTHPSRDHAHRLYALRTEQMLRDAGIASLKGGW